MRVKGNLENNAKAEVDKISKMVVKDQLREKSLQSLKRSLTQAS